MGKAGDALRAAKAQRVTYTFTREQLEDHDRILYQRIRKEEKERLQLAMDEEYKRRKAEIDQHIKEVWEEREKQFGNNPQGFQNLLNCMISIPIRILIEDYGWPAYKGRNNRTVEFCRRMEEELNKIAGNEQEDITMYCDEVYRLYGFKFTGVDDESQ